ncbi:hypothetical protein SAMN05660976_02626 [Nonomuraea pusilla]|uniref:Uncharacterized protein n=1 Tax=Nonomuraea pusilla TaxID=46177 RepID=A0A1H7QQN7_9ACTN|nr:hypothetical protein SAMN05660976_02626 [Nonomuraea pusilla]
MVMPQQEVRPEIGIEGTTQGGRRQDRTADHLAETDAAVGVFASPRAHPVDRGRS